MRYVKKPWALCKHLSTFIVSCTLIIRVLSIGYVIAGFVAKFQDHLILYKVIQKLNNCNLGIFPLGSFINALIFAPTPAVIVNVLNSVITYLGIFKRRIHYLQISTIISLLILIWYAVLIALWSWLIGEVYNGIKECFAKQWETLNFVGLDCCGVDRPTTPPYPSTPSPTGCPYSVGCFDIISKNMNTYGSSYITVLVVNCITEIVMIVGVSYLHGFHALLIKTTSAKHIVSRNIHKLRYGVIVSMYSFLKENWKRNKLLSLFGYLSLISLAIDGTMILAILLMRYNYYDITLTSGFYEISGGNDINLGYTKDSLLITSICVLIWSILSKALCLCGIRLMKKWLFVLFIISEIIALMVECIILIFAGLLMRALYCCFWKDSSVCSEYTYQTSTVPSIYLCASWENGALFLWTSMGILIFHIILKIVLIISSDRVYKRSLSAATTTLTKSVQIKNDSVGFFNEILLKIKTHPVIAAFLGISIIICIVDCLYFCGLLVVRYGHTTGHSLHISDVLNKIPLGYLPMSSHRDNAIIICLVSLTFSFSLQLGKFVSITWQSPKWTLFILWLELFVIVLQFVSLSLVALLLRLVYCCLFTSNWVFSPDDLKVLCTNDQKIWERVMLQSWLMFGFGVTCVVLQIMSIIFGYRYFHKSADGYLGIFKGVVELFRSMFYTVSHNRYINEKKMPNYNNTYGMYSIISAISLVLEMVFIVCLYAYYFTEGDSSLLLDGLDRFSHHLYNMESLYRAVSITILVIIPLATSLRIAAFTWFWFRKSKISFYTILIFIPVWTLGEIVTLCYTSYVLRLAYECKNSDFFSFSNHTTALNETTPIRSNICVEFGSKLCVQSGLIAAYLVIHIILHICLLNTMDALHPYIVKYGDRKRFSVHLFNKAIAELKKQTIIQRAFFTIHAISLVLNLTIWIGLILMGLIPRYIPTDFFDIISRTQISFGSTDMESAVLGVMYSLIAVVPLFEASHVIGLVGLFKQNKVFLWIFIISVFVFYISDLVYLIFSSEIAHFRNCVCGKGTNCIQYNLLTTEKEQNSTRYNLTITEKEQNIVCGDLFLDSSRVLLAYILLTVIIHVVVVILAIKILRGFGKTRVGIDDENINLPRGTNQQPSSKIEKNKVPNEITEENLSNQSINKTENNVPESEINVPSNNQQHELNSENKKKKKKRKKKKKKIVTEEEL